MIGIIIVTHSDMASGIHKAVEMIAGKQENFSSIGFYVDDTLEELSQKIDSEIKKNNCENTIIFTDMFGDTPTNVSAVVTTKINAVVVTGVNLGMVLESLTCREYLEIDRLIEQITKAGTDGIRYITKELIEKNC